METQDWKNQIPVVDHMHRLNPHSVQGNMDETDLEAARDPRRWYDQKGSAPQLPPPISLGSSG